MAKSKVRVFVKGDQKLILHDAFLYEVQIFAYNIGSYNLEDTKVIQTKEYQTPLNDHFLKDKKRFGRETTLIAAPLRWLEENNYSESCQNN